MRRVRTDMTVLLDRWKKIAERATGRPQPTFRCSSCQDTGWTLLIGGWHTTAGGNRFEATPENPLARRCVCFKRARLNRPDDPTTERFH